MDLCMNGWVGVCIHEWVGRCMHTEEYIGGCMDAWREGEGDRWMPGYMGGCIHEWINGCMCTCTKIKFLTFF